MLFVLATFAKMLNEKLISDLTMAAMERNQRSIEIWTSFLQEASVLVWVFGLLDTWAKDALTIRMAIGVSLSGALLLFAAFSVRSMYYRITKRTVVKWASKLDDTIENGGAQ